MPTGKTSSVIQGAGMFLNLISVLSEEIVKAGGHPEMLYFAQREHARPLMREVAELIVKSNLWKIPRSWIEEQISKKCTDQDNLASDTKFGWTEASKLIDDLITHRFAINMMEADDDETYPIPRTILDQLRSKHAKYPYVVLYEDVSYVVVHLFHDINKIDRIWLAPAKYFDLNG